jgi:hypothetical protein
MRFFMAGSFACGLPVACADPCIDDGLGQDGQGNCLQASASQTEGATESNGDTVTVSNTQGTDSMASNTEGMTGSQTGTETVGETLDGTDTDTAGGTLWCVDADGDGFGDPDMCQQSDEPVPGSVDNDDDCDDGNEHTYPGAAELEDPRACMRDEDDDGWGDTDPPPGVEPGTDCIDDNANVFPGAAENEDPPDLCAEDQDGDGWGDTDPPPGAEPGTDCDDTNPAAFPGAAPNENPPDLCTIDADGDGWGDANPGGGGGGGSGPQPGSDCYDGNVDLNPDTMQLSAFMPYNGNQFAQRTLQWVNPNTAALTPFVTLLSPMGNVPDINLVTATIDETGRILANDLDGDELFTIDYEATCGMATGVAEGLGPYVGPGQNAIVCGLEFGGDGSLYGIDNNDTLITFDPVTGQDTGAIPITLAGGGDLDISSCGMAYDCAQDRLLVANGIDWSIYSVDPATGAATLVRDLGPYFGPGMWTPVGLAWEPVSRTVYLSTGQTLFNIDIDDAAAAPVQIGGFGGPVVSNLGYVPICSP